MANKIPFNPINTIKITPAKPTTERKQVKASPIKEKQNLVPNKKESKSKNKNTPLPALPQIKQPTKGKVTSKADIVASNSKLKSKELLRSSQTSVKPVEKKEKLSKQTKKEPQQQVKKLNIKKPEITPSKATKKAKKKTPLPQEAVIKDNMADKTSAVHNQKKFNNTLINKTITEKLAEETTSPLIKSKIILITNYVLLAEKYEITISDLLFHKLSSLLDNLFERIDPEKLTSFSQALNENLHRVSNILNKSSAEVFHIINNLLSDTDVSKLQPNKKLSELSWDNFRAAAELNKTNVAVFLSEYFNELFQPQINKK